MESTPPTSAVNTQLLRNLNRGLDLNQSGKEYELFRAISKKDLAEVRRLLSAGRVDPNKHLSGSGTCVHAAAFDNNVLRELINAGGNISIKYKFL